MAAGRKRGAAGKGGAQPPRPPRVEPEWVSREEALFFPANTSAKEHSAKLSLPSSGLAEEILGRVEAAGVEPDEIVTAATDVVVSETPPAPAPSPSRTHNISFFAAPAREEKKAVEATEHLVTFFLSREEYGVDVRLVQEIIRVTEVTPVPRAPEAIKGVINLRGRIIPVVDLKRRLGIGEVEVTRLARIVVVRLRDRLIGLLVDGASQVLKVPVSVIEAAPEEVVEIDVNFIRGVAKLEKRLIVLVDLAKVLGVELREVLSVSGPP
jgi:purine-binding chemotaxis protein CheW